MITTLVRILKTFFGYLDFNKRKDIIFVRNQFKERLHKDLNLINPKTFNEKIQWLKLFDHNPLYSILADKYLVREYVKAKVGDNILNEIYGVYSKFEDINFNDLSNAFVIKATHGSGWNIICKNKEELDLSSVKTKLESWLSDNYYKYGKEFVYKNIKPRIIIEKYLKYENNTSLNDYKFFCFHGEPKFIQVDINRFTNHQRNFYDLGWNLLPFELHHESYNKIIKKPQNLEKMINIAKKLSAGIKFCRVDLYDLEDKVIFGEITFYPGNGLELFNPPEYDEKIGKYLKL